jgi:hypothetical protein
MIIIQLLNNPVEAVGVRLRAHELQSATADSLRENPERRLEFTTHFQLRGLVLRCGEPLAEHCRVQREYAC